MADPQQLDLMMGDYRVVKGNAFVNARYDWSTPMHRIIMMAIAQLRKEDLEFTTQRIYVRDLAELADINSGQIYEEAEKACRALLDQKLEVRSDNGDYHGYNLLSDTHFYPGKGYLELRFNANMKPYLLELKERFTQYQLRQAIQLSSPYAIRFYELCSQWANVGWFDLTVDDVRAMFKLEHKYKQTTDLRRTVLDGARTELKKKCDLYFDYTQKKHGRAIVGFKFKIVRKGHVSGTPAPVPRAAAPDAEGVDAELKAFRAYLVSLTAGEREALEERALAAARREIDSIDTWKAEPRQSIVEDHMLRLWRAGEVEATAE